MIHDLNIHGITEIKVFENKAVKPGDIPLYYYRKLVITDDRGNEISLNLFGNRETELEFKDG